MIVFVKIKPCRKYGKASVNCWPTRPEKAEELARLPSEGAWTHDHPITYETAKSFGLPVRCDIPSEFLDLMNLYPQPVGRQPTVEYLPERRRYEGFRGNRD